MGWIALALLSGVLVALRDAALKEVLVEVDRVVAIWAASVVAAVPLGLAAVALGEAPPLDRGLAALLLGSTVGNVAALVLLARGLESEDLSVAVPLLGASPALTMLTGWMILGERPSPLGAVGVLGIVAGSYLLRLDRRRDGALAPFRVLAARPGSRAVLVVVLLLSVVAVLDKKGVQESSPLFWAAAVSVGMAVGLAPVAGSRLGALRRLRRGSAWRLLTLAGASRAASSLALMLAFQTGLAAYTVAVRRVSGPTSVLLGRVWFGERELRARLAGALLIAGGVAVIALA